MQRNALGLLFAGLAAALAAVAAWLATLSSSAFRGRGR